MLKTLGRWAFEYIGILPFFMLAIIAVGIPLGVAGWAYDGLTAHSAGHPLWQQIPWKGISLGACYYVYGFTLILWVPILSVILRARLKTWRGPAISLGALPWYLSATLTLLTRYSFLEFVTPTPYNILFYRLMGMKVGIGVQINSTSISDPSMIEIGDFATIGGTANVMAHYAQGGYLIIAPVKIGNGATVGLRSTIMGGVELGAKAKVLANSFVLPNTKIPPGETWGGVPAKKIDIRDFRQERPTATET